MKNLIKGLAFLSMLSLFSCTKVLYTHEQVISLYKTKQDVIKNFGVATEKKMNDSTEQWLYRYEKAGPHSVKEFPNTITTNVTEFNRYNRYIIFTMDKQGNIIRCDYEGVDLAVRGKNPAGTIALIAGGLALITVGYIAVHSITFSYNIQF
jgi:hypothetical protein